MAGLADLLKRRIETEGPLSLEAYMREALAHPEFGYYRGGDRLGAAGDFITAPDISQMFGELISLWSAEVWRLMGRPDPVIVAELGPGRGTLMADFLRAAKSVPDFLKAIRLHLVEISPGFRARQAQALATVGLAEPPQWHDDLADVPAGPTILIANEFFDALPIRQFEKTAQGWRERLVAFDAAKGGMGFVLSDTAGDWEGDSAAASGSIAEINPTGLIIAQAIGKRLTRDGGVALLIDYGHCESGFGDTLQAVRAHAYQDIFANPGDADLTAHVDFAALAKAAAGGGATASACVPQRQFLESLGISARLEALLMRATADQARALTSGYRRLLDPAEMGTLFKVMALMNATLGSLPGLDNRR